MNKLNSDISVNIYTKNDDNIIKNILQDPDWSISKIKNALPYKHTTDNIINKLLQFKPNAEIQTHITNNTILQIPKERDVIMKESTPKEYTKNPWTKAEIAILTANMNKLSNKDPQWKTLLPKHTLGSISKKKLKLREDQKKSTTQTERQLGWLKNDIELLTLALTKPDNKPIEQIINDLMTSFTEHHTAVEINDMVKTLGLSLPKPVKLNDKELYKPKEMHLNKDARIANLEELYNLVQRLGDDAQYDIYVNFGNGIVFDVCKRKDTKDEEGQTV